VTGTIDQIILGRYFRGLAESEAMRAIVQEGLKPSRLRVEGDRVFYVMPDQLEEIELCRCRSAYEAATVANEINDKLELQQALQTLTAELAGLLRAYSAAVYYFAHHETDLSIDEQQQLNAVADRMELCCEYGDDLFNEIVLPFLHQNKFSVANITLNREKTRTVKMLNAAEKLLYELNLSVAAGQEFSEGIVDAAAELEQSMNLSDEGQADENE